MSNLQAIHARADISKSCPVTFTVDGSDVAHVLFGESREAVEPNFDMASPRSLVAAGGRAVAEMNARHEQQELRREATPP